MKKSPAKISPYQFDKLRLLSILGGKCAGYEDFCDVTDPRCLEFDHINGDGCIDRQAAYDAKKTHDNGEQARGRVNGADITEIRTPAIDLFNNELCEIDLESLNKQHE
jgi:hypothetical protein